MAINITSKSAREKLAPRREPYWSRIEAGLFIGYRRADQGDGTWIARRRNEHGKQEYRALGTFADYDAAKKAAIAWAATVTAGVSSRGMTIKEVCEHYVKHQRLHKSATSADDAEGRFKRLVYSADIGKIDLDKLKTSHVRAWMADQVSTAEPDAEDEDDVRRSKDSANRNLASLKAALNLALRDRLIASDAGWKTVEKFKDVGRRRESFVTAEQRKALLAVCRDDLAGLVKAMLLTGARPGELANACAQDFDKSQGVLALEGKTGRRVVTLSTSAAAFFVEQTKGKIAHAPILTTEYGQPWNKDVWKKPFKEAVKAAALPDTIVMYSLRHTAISEMIAGGMDSFVVARLAGTSTEMIDKHYGHLRHDRTRAKLDAVAIL
ncbi:TPA: tyrosine-type recombinase/integrase [Burkholderia vietnamiensis]|uniref:tyrosine-type recombinase/integrase n=1 Tax=Burkholderia vietnamiensis TaxID=60552 RepID=UPI001593A736|nr:tyrosine-type recombinase/integrase [Burkholderia vietnamiensis]HDR9011480.1 tyrosine-type recombinase/integrase [Burkholderia vietnamiensis]HDR9016612.1 tyrosine-type recombinase/integrase [Burkholderia vietnamiensis]